MPDRDDDDPSDDLDQLLDDRTGSDAPRGHGRRRSWLRRGRPVRAWKSSDELDDELDAAAPKHTRVGRRSGKPPTYFRARDSLLFEPLVTLAIVVIILVGMYAYTSNWPPAYAVESNSMQHGAGDHVGYLNAGDFVLAQKVPSGSIVPYLVAINPTQNNAISTYGEPGDVVIYNANGGGSSTPIIHRAILYLEYNPVGQSYSAPELAGLPCGGAPGSVYEYSGSGSSCSYTNLTGTLYLYNLGWQKLALTVNFNVCRTELGAHSGYLTLGDNNSYFDQVPASCGAGSPISSLVEPGWIIGVARGLLPWFGALKLLLDGNSQLVPAESWELLGLSIAGVILGGAGIHFLLRRLGVQSELRRREREREELVPGLDDEFDDRAPRPSVRNWDDSEPEPKQKPPTRLSYEERRRSHFVSHPRTGRPHRRPEPSTSDESDGS